VIQRIGAAGFILLLVAGWVGLLGRQQAGGERTADVPQQSGGLPEMVYLGEGPATFEIDPNYYFIVKHRPFTIDFIQGPTYEASSRERVWSTTFVPEGGVQLYDELYNFGAVGAGCVVSMVRLTTM